MTAVQQNNFIILNKTPNRFNSFLLLLLASTIVIAQTNGILRLPESYRTPLSDMVYDHSKEWRIEPEDENPWREGKEVALIKPRIKVEFFPKYNYDSVQDPYPGSLFQNANELDKPVSNIFRYTF